MAKTPPLSLTPRRFMSPTKVITATPRRTRCESIAGKALVMAVTPADTLTATVRT